MANVPSQAPAYERSLALAALGIVYGDIGTSPIYAVRESFIAEHDVAVSTANVLGVLSLVFWALVIVICIKYLVFVLRADNRGEGGILALTALVTPVGGLLRGRRVLIMLGLFATALLYGDGMITPAISVLSAVEGLAVATEFFEPYVIPITVVILVALFSFQRHGTAGVGKVFGPITLLWFITLAALGVWNITKHPGIFIAVNPLHAVRFFAANGINGVLVLGSVFLVVTGGEALYADMGHFGKRPIRLAWFAVVLPALLLNYFGQGALLISNPAAAANPFFLMAPVWALYPVVAIATVATVIASQALISGSYSLTMQAVQLGYSPRLDIQHTSADEKGQIYIPAINWVLMICCIGLVLGFRTSSNLAAAYGVAVTTTMVATSLLFYVVARERWRWSLPVAIVVGGAFLLVDVAFWGANLLKIPHGGWFPLVVGAIIFTMLTTWKKGRQILAQRMKDRTLPIDEFVDSVLAESPTRVPRTAVYMYSNPTGTPPALLHNLKHNMVLHARIVFLSVTTEDIPFVEPERRHEVRVLQEGIHAVTLRYGFMEEADVPAALVAIDEQGLRLKRLEISYFLGRETIIPSNHVEGMALWRDRLFMTMSNNARSAASFFKLPPNQVVELGTQVEL